MNDNRHLDPETADAINSGLTIEEEPIQYDGTLAERKERSVNNVKMLVPILRTALGNTVLRELWQRGKNKRAHAEKIDMVKWIAEVLAPKNLEFLHTKAVTLNFFPKDENQNQMPIPLEQYKDFNPSPFDCLKAINRAVSFANYGNWKRNQGFCYVVDSDHKMTRQMITGNVVWSEPKYITFSWREAKEQEDYLSPFTFEYIQDPDDSSRQIRIKKYRRMGNAFHTIDTPVSLSEDNPLLVAVKKMTPAECISKQYDTDLHPSEFMRLAEGEVAFVDREMQADGVRIWPVIDQEEKRVVLYHAGYYDQSQQRLIAN